MVLYNVGSFLFTTSAVTSVCKFVRICGKASLFTNPALLAQGYIQRHHYNEATYKANGCYI